MAKRRANREGSIFKESATGFWCAEVTLPDGSRKRKRSKKQQVVREWLLEQRKTIQAGLPLLDDKVLFGDYLDGFLIDVSETAKDAGFRFPMAVTSAVWMKCIEVPESCEGEQDEAGRLWDILNML